MNSWIVMIGGGLTLAAILLGIEWANMTKPVWSCLILFFLGLMVALWDCGRRVLTAEGRVKSQVSKDDLSKPLLILMKRINDIEGMDAPRYMKELATDTVEDVRTSVAIELARKELYAQCGNWACVLFLHTPPLTAKAPPNHPWATIETVRLQMLEHLYQLSANLKKMVESLPS